MPDREEPHYNRRLVRFWVLFWPLFFTGLICAVIAAAALLTILMAIAVGEAGLALWPMFLFAGGEMAAKSGFLPVALAAALMAARFSAGGESSLGSVVLTGTILGASTGLLHDGRALNALIGVGAGVGACLAMRGVAFAIKRFWMRET